MVFGVAEDFRVISTSPSDGKSNVSLNAGIEVRFSQAVDDATLHTGTFVVARNSATPIAGEVKFEATSHGEYIATFTPQVVLYAETTYQVTLVGLSHPLTGGGAETVIKNVVGVSLGRNTSFVFSTGAVSVQPPVIELPIESSSIRETRPKFQWSVIAGATNYEIEIGTSELMDPLYVPEGSPVVYPITVLGDQSEYTPDFEFGTGQQYYWRIRTYQNDTLSAWSTIMTFYILESTEEAPYVPPPSVPFQPTGDTTRLFGGEETFRVLNVEPVHASLDQNPDYFRIWFNKSLDEDYVDTSDDISVVLRGIKMLKSDPNVREPGDDLIEEYYVDDEDPTVLVVIPTGGSHPG